MLKSKFIIGVVLSAICVVQSCKKEVFDTTVPIEVDPSLNCDNVNYENSAKSIFEAKCNTCHGATNQGPGDYNEVDILKRDLAKIRGRVESGTMPPAGSPQLTEVETSAMLLWIDCGASFEGTPCRQQALRSLQKLKQVQCCCGLIVERALKVQ